MHRHSLSWDPLPQPRPTSDFELEIFCFVFPLLPPKFKGLQKATRGVVSTALYHFLLSVVSVPAWLLLSSK